MKAVTALLAAGVILCSAFGLPADQKVLMVVKDGSGAMDKMLTKEIGVMTSVLRQAGYEPVVATESGKLLQGKTTSLQPDLRLGDVSLQDYVGVLVPCMGYGIGNGIAAEGVSLVKEAFVRGMPIAAQNGGVEFLAKAGILKGKRFAIWPGLEDIAPDGIYQGKGVVADGLVVTSGACPYRTNADTTEELTRQFIRLLAAK